MFLPISRRDWLIEIISSSIYGFLCTEYVNGNGPDDSQPDAYNPVSVTPPSPPALYPPSATNPPPFAFSTPTDYQVTYSVTKIKVNIPIFIFMKLTYDINYNECSH